MEAWCKRQTQSYHLSGSVVNVNGGSFLCFFFTCIFANNVVWICACVFACVETHVCVQGYVNACGGPRLISRLPWWLYLIHWGKVSQSQSSFMKLSLKSQLVLEILHLCFPYPVVAERSHISVVSGDLNSDLHICMASIFYRLSHLHSVKGIFLNRQIVCY